MTIGQLADAFSRAISWAVCSVHWSASVKRPWVSRWTAVVVRVDFASLVLRTRIGVRFLPSQHRVRIAAVRQCRMSEEANYDGRAAAEWRPRGALMGARFGSSLDGRGG